MGRDQNHANTGPRCAISELKERRKAARPSPTNAATQDAAPAVRVARRACFLCAKRAPPPEKSAARLPTTKKKPRPGQTRTTPPDLASRACLCPRRSTRGLPFRTQKTKRSRRIHVHTARTKKGNERARRRRSASAGGRRRKAPCSWVPLRVNLPSSSAERRMHIAERRSTKHAPGFATRETDRGRQVIAPRTPTREGPKRCGGADVQ